VREWEALERSVARKLGTRPTRGSGNGHLKGDINTEYFKVETKCTTKPDHIVLKVDWLDKIAQEARADNKLPILVIRCRLAEYWILLEGFKPSRTVPPWRSLRLQMHPALETGMDEPDLVESELAFWRVYSPNEALTLIRQLEASATDTTSG
jgi:hypothetical protein